MVVKGNVPWNKGKHIVHSGSFKKGHIGYKSCLGKHPSKETIKKMRLTHIGKHQSEKVKIKISATMKTKGIKPIIIYSMKGKHHTKESKIKNRIAHLGEKSHCWKGGISFEPYTPEFNERLKEQIRRRDNFTCQLCGLIQNGHKHTVHHIDYNKKNNNPENLITLCTNCHSKTNIINRNYWTDYFNKKIQTIFPNHSPESQNSVESEQQVGIVHL